MADLLPKPRTAANYIEMRRKGKNNVQVWRGWVDGEQVITQWGMLDGKMQQTIDIPGPNGKPDTKAYCDAKQAARDVIMRQCATKAKRGYKLMNELKGAIAKPLALDLAEIESKGEIDFEGPLPPNVAFSKPVNTISVERILKMEKKGPDPLVGGEALAWTVKMNGMCFIVSADVDGDIWIQTRGKMIVENKKFPHLVEEFEGLLPPCSIMLCEFYVGEGKTMAEFKAMGEITRSLDDRAISMQKTHGLVKAYVFRVPFWKGAWIEDTTFCHSWLEFIQALREGWEDESRPGGYQPGFDDADYVDGAKIWDCLSYEEAMSQLELNGHEGWVIYMRDKPLGEQSLSFLGQPDRPPVCFKVKNDQEDDFIALWDPEGNGEHCGTKCTIPDRQGAMKQTKSGRCCICGKLLKPSGTYGSGKNMKRVGTMSLYQIGYDGVKRYICEVSSGLKDAKKASIAKEGLYVGVLNIGFASRAYVRDGEDTNALQHPKVLGFRRSKELNECKNPKI
jgi:hypothetical protein